jgi:predicted acetyltransferase
MAEFFILRAYRRRGIGTNVAHILWKRLSGQWEVRVMHSNVPAQLFWANAIAKFTGEVAHPVRVERGGGSWQIFSFSSKRIV